MMKLSINRIFSLVLAILVCLGLSMASAHNHLETGYVPWGVDEYELFGLSKLELAKKFKDKLHFNNDKPYSRALER